MHRFANKFESTYHKIIDRATKPHQAHATPSSTFPSEQDFYRYRKQRGVNLGSWFVLERWIADEPFQFAAAPGQSDLDVARGAQARELLERHWDTWITEIDWSWIAHCGINAIGYYHLCGIDASVLAGTDFAGMENIFGGAWQRIVKAIQTAHQFGIGVLIDLHAAPGKQNRDAHAGTSNPPHFFDEAHHRAHTIQVLRTLVRALLSGSPPFSNIIGVEVLNEPQPSDDRLLQNWYSSVMGELRSLDPSLPIYLSDCWKTDGYAQYIESTSPTALTVLDHHLYRCFTGADISTRAQDHTRALMDPEAETPKMLSRVSSMLNKNHGAIVSGMVWGTESRIIDRKTGRNQGLYLSTT
ncbi:glycoside hydrolase superfamily [Infundibulicybe gibba]|nr:glycoside hydrolase superfamily [Infundibulicybe gibba]